MQTQADIFKDNRVAFLPASGTGEPFPPVYYEYKKRAEELETQMRTPPFAAQAGGTKE